MNYLPDYIVDYRALGEEVNARLPDVPVTSMDAMQAVVGADGDLDLAAARLGTKRANILTAIVTDPNNHDTLARYFRAHQLIKLFGLIETVTSSLEPELDELSPRDKARTLTALLDTFARFTDKDTAPAVPGNPIENTLKMFPPQVQAAIRALAVVEHTPEVDLSS